MLDKPERQGTNIRKLYHFLTDPEIFLGK